MDNYVYNAFDRYFKILETTGYLKESEVNNLIVLNFYYDLLCNDYRGYVTVDDYASIEKALYCLYGSSCLIPYPDFLKMGKLKLGEMSEILYRLKVSEAQFIELRRMIGNINVPIEDCMQRLDDQSERLGTVESTKVIKAKVGVGDNYMNYIPELDIRNIFGTPVQP